MTGTGFIRRLQISHNTPCFPAKILQNLCFSFFLGITVVPRETEDNAYAKFWGANKVHYGRCASGESYMRVMYHLFLNRGTARQAS